MAEKPDRGAQDAEFDEILRRRDIRTLFQPVVHLPSSSVVGYEALVRGPEDSTLPTADSLVAAANRAGRLTEFDWAARASACREATAAGLDVDHVLFLNIEPISLDSECPEDLWPDIERAFQSFRVVLEVTERSLDRDPATLLDGVERQRPRVGGIGLDDVGADQSTLAMLALVSPDVIKLDRSVVQATPDQDVSRVLTLVHEQAQRTGAMVLAEGVETAQHRYQALAQGAQIAQGQLFGCPGPLPSPERPQQRAPIHRSAPMSVVAPFDALSGQVDASATDEALIALTRQHATYAQASQPSLYVSLLPGPDLLHKEDLQRLAQLARTGTFAAVLGPGIASEPGEGVRGTGTRREVLPRDEWAAIAVGASGSSAVLARRLPDGGWAYGVTKDPTRVIAAARSLVRLLGPSEPRYHFAS